VTSSVAPRLDRGARLACDVILNRPDEDGFARGSVEQRLGEKGGCGFAVSAGDAGRGELALGMPKESGGSLGEGAAAVFDFEHRQASFVDGEVVEGWR